MLKKIVIIGPESTGKSTLCSQLAAHYKTIWVREYAREYLLEHGTDYSYDDLLTIAQGQIRLEEKAIENYELGITNDELRVTSYGFPIPNSQYPIPVFMDTDMQVMKVWCQFVFGKTHPWIEEQLAQRQYDLYLLCNTDLAWVKDELREYPDLATREKLFAIYKTMMQNQSVPWVEIKGASNERLQQAIAAVDSLLAQQ